MRIARCTPSRGLVHSRTEQTADTARMWAELHGHTWRNFWTHNLPIPNCFNNVVMRAYNWGADLIWILEEALGARGDTDAGRLLHGGRVRWIVIWLNVAVAFFVGWLHVSGLTTALTRMRFAPGETYVPPTWLTASNGIMLAGSGALALVFFVALLWTLIPLAFRRFRVVATASPDGDTRPSAS